MRGGSIPPFGAFAIESMMRFVMKTLLVLILFLLMAVVGFSQQITDPNFNTKVARPAYTKNHPKLLFDEAHNNFHTAGGRYKGFAELITNDGYQVVSNKEKFTEQVLRLQYSTNR
jgi:hypothetical protein